MISALDNMFDVALALKPLVYEVGEHGNSEVVRAWGDLNAKAQHGCGGACGCTPQTCAHCKPLGDKGSQQAQEILNLLERQE